MNNLATTEPDVLELLPAKTMLKVIEQAQKAKKYSALFHETVTSNAGLFRALEELDIDSSFCLSSGDINLTFTGDGPRIAAVWAQLRRSGYEPNRRPTKGEPTFYTHWHKKGFSTIWMQFASSVCRRVQVGTKTEEIAIYEVQCGEMPELEAEAAVPSLRMIDGEIADDIPF